jgi:FkbM family methyltransferase
MRIAIVDTLGLCYDGTTLSKRGLGGSESAVILVSKELAKIGFDVTVFNDCTSDNNKPGIYDGVVFKPLQEIENESGFDVFIASRSVAAFAPPEIKDRFKTFVPLPNFEQVAGNSKHRVLWMHDTFCDGDDLIEDFVINGRIHEIFTLSDFQTSYVTNCDHGRRRNFEVLKKHIYQTRNGIGSRIPWVDVKAKDPDLFVYNASVTKGMIPLVTKIWPIIKQNAPNAKLKIIGGYYKFRDDHGPDEQEKTFHEMVENHGNGIEFTGIIKQSEIASIMAEASFMLYPAAFPETFGISSLEALAHNTPIITCEFGALEETAFDLACYKIPYSIEPNGLFPWINPDDQANRFINLTLNAYSNKYLHQQKMYACNQVKSICGWDSVALQWKQHFFNKLGWFLPVEDYRKVSKINHDVRKVFGRRFFNMEELQEPRNKQQKINVIVPVYNAENYIEKCIQSIEAQDYDNYHVYIIDDCSTDSTRSLIYDSIKDQSKFSIIYNAENKGAVCNQIETVSELCNDFDDIIMLVDGDDWLINDPNIFHKYNNIYTEEVEFTYGSCWSVVDNIPLIAQEYPPEVKEVGGYRDYKFNWNMPYTHLRTFRRHLLNRLDSFDCFKDENGEWLKAGGDTAVFYNLIEAAVPERVVCISDVVYNYNDANPINDYKVNSDEQTKTSTGVISKKKVEKFSVVMPTMWRCTELTLRLLNSLVNHALVGEIRIINNDKDRTPDWEGFNNPKVKVYTPESNIGVNPAWNIGVEDANNDKICIVNDDIVFDTMLFDKIVDKIIPGGGVYGIINGDPNMGQPVTTDGSIDFIEWKPGDIIHSFGQLMFVHKKNWEYIPEELIINFGDNYILHTHLLKKQKIILIYNIVFESDFSATIRDTSVELNTAELNAKERMFFGEWMESNPLIVKEDSMKKKILIGIPTARYIEPDTFKAIYDLEVPDGFEVDFQYFYGYNVDQVRNLIADWTVNSYDYLLAVDHDITFPPDTLRKLLSHDKPVVTAIYRQRNEPQTLEVYDNYHGNIPYEHISGKGLVEIGGCGFGCVLVKKEVFVSVGYPQFVYHDAILHKDTLSEDLDFCLKARNKGHAIFVDTSILCGHYGNKMFTVELPKLIENSEQRRLRDLANTRMLPKDHNDYLFKMKASGFEPKVIYDIGSCVMHWTQEAERVWPTANYVLFEAMDAVKFLYDETPHKYNLGLLSAYDEEIIMFNENPEHPGGNSYYDENVELSPAAAHLYPADKKVRKIAMSLDTVVKERGFPLPDLIKMDIQGAELDVLKGAHETLRTCNHLILEMQHKDYNLGAPKAQDIISYLKDLGFENENGMFCGSYEGVDGDYHFIRI